MGDFNLGDLVALVAAELETGPEDVVRLALSSGAADELTDAEAVWRHLFAIKPEAFVGRSPYATAVGFACRYARRRTPDLVKVLELTPAERRLLRATRRWIAPASGLEHWRGFRHLSYEPSCQPLMVTIGLRRRYSGGFAFTWHPGLSRTALYPATRISEYREISADALISVLLHEESHLAVSLEAIPGEIGDVGGAIFEMAAEIVQHSCRLRATGYRPTRVELLGYLNDIGKQGLSGLLASLTPEDAAVPELIRQASTLAVVASRGDAVLARVLGTERFAAVAEAIGIDNG